ncbi:hypothetical protein Tco_0422909 [Tanacetum coccineum]
MSTKSFYHQFMIEFGKYFRSFCVDNLNGVNQVVSKSSAVTTADAPDKRQQQPDSTSSTLTLATTVTADGNFNVTGGIYLKGQSIVEIAVLGYDWRKYEYKKMPTKIELTLEQSQQGVSNDVLAEDWSNTLFYQNHKDVLLDIEDELMDPVIAMHDPSHNSEFFSKNLSHLSQKRYTLYLLTSSLRCIVDIDRWHSDIPALPITKTKKSPFALWTSKSQVVWVFDEVFSTWMAFGGNTRDLGSFGEEIDEITDLHQILEEVLLTERGDGVASIKL